MAEKWPKSVMVGGCRTVAFLEVVRCGRFFGERAPAKKIAILVICNTCGSYGSMLSRRRVPMSAGEALDFDHQPGAFNQGGPAVRVELMSPLMMPIFHHKHIRKRNRQYTHSVSAASSSSS